MQNMRMGEPWTAPNRKVHQDGKLYRNPLEFLAAERLVLIIIKYSRLPTEVKAVVIWVDNYSSCDCINMGRALSPTMRRALRILVIIESADLLKLVAQNVRTEENCVADCLDHGHYERATQQVGMGEAVTWGLEDGLMQEWES